MPPKSLQRGDYSLLYAIESSSRPGDWYRVLTDRASGALSCDCPTWIFAGRRNTEGQRTCPHTAIGQLLVRGGSSCGAERVPSSTATFPQAQMLLHETQAQWPGLRGEWNFEAKEHIPVNGHPYTFVLLRLALGNGTGVATGVAAFAEQHGVTLARLVAGVAGWCGYAIAAEVARLGGYPMAGRPPEHFVVKTTRRARAVPQDGRAVLPPLGLVDLLKVGDTATLADGLTPAQRAENTLRLFLGEALYGQLERQGFLDVESRHYGLEQRVYRLRRDPQKVRERRVRVFEHGRYCRDLCLVRGQDCPEADHFLAIFLGLLSDEMSTLAVLSRYNVFELYSDGTERETTPAVWQGRTQSCVG